MTDDPDALTMMAARPFVPPTGPADFPADRYRVEFVSAHDGDTITVAVTREFPVRLFGIDTPEIRSNAHGKATDLPAAIAARDFLADLLASGDCYLVERGQTFGRVLANVYVARPDGSFFDAGPAMIAAGHAKPYP